MASAATLLTPPPAGPPPAVPTKAPATAAGISYTRGSAKTAKSAACIPGALTGSRLPVSGFRQ
jgi:hypothetical protein